MNKIISFFVDGPTWLKWALLVFLAGFVGQFGKSLTLNIIKIIRKKKRHKSACGNLNEGGRSGSDKDNYKLKKKESKAMVKLQKKRIKTR